MNGFLRGVAMISLVRMLLDMLLPEGKMQRLCDVIVGLALMLSILESLFAMIYGERAR